MPKEKTYANRTLEKALRERGAPVRLMWEVPGPKDTGIAWMTCLAAGKGVVIVQTYKDGGGWDAYTPCCINDTEATIQDVVSRLSVPLLETN